MDCARILTHLETYEGNPLAQLLQRHPFPRRDTYIQSLPFAFRFYFQEATSVAPFLLEFHSLAAQHTHTSQRGTTEGSSAVNRLIHSFSMLAQQLSSCQFATLISIVVTPRPFSPQLFTAAQSKWLPAKCYTNDPCLLPQRIPSNSREAAANKRPNSTQDPMYVPHISSWNVLEITSLCCSLVSLLKWTAVGR